MGYDEEKTPTDIDWENRTLCIDESCIGVIGPDGRCKECGKPFAGEQKQDTPHTHDDDEPSYKEDHSEDEENDLPLDIESDIDWENRTLCIDESCIGVIGPDGRCKECGKPFTDP